MAIRKSGETQLNETLRIELFSGGVFCIAITLLSIQVGIEVKEGETNSGLTDALLKKWPFLLSYLIGFVNVVLIWVGHYNLFRNLRKLNSRIVIANAFLVMLVALISLPTKTLGAYLLTDAINTAVIFYSGYLVLISIAYWLLWFACTRKRDIIGINITDNQIKRFTQRTNIGILTGVLMMGIAFASPWAAIIFLFVLWVYWIAFGLTRQ